MRIILTLVLSFSFIFLNAQLNDSLANVNLENGKNQLFYGKYNESISSFENVLDYYKTSKNYLKIAESYNKLSQAHFLNSHINEALVSAQNALTHSRRATFENKLEEANALNNLGSVLAVMGDFENALDNHHSALNIKLKYLKEDNYGLASSYFYLGNFSQRDGNFKNAFNYLNKALELNLNDSPKHKILVANINEVLGFTNYDLGNFDEALVYFHRTLALAQEVYKSDNSYFVKVYNDLGLIYSIKERFNESLKYYQKALSVSIKNYGLDKHPDQIRIHFNIGTIYRNVNQKDKALYHTRKCLDMGRAVFGEGHRNLFFPYSQLGQIYNNEEGVSYILKALDICKKDKRINNLRISFLYEYLSEIYTTIKNDHEALNYAQKALELRLQLFENDNINIVRSYNNLSKKHLRLNNYENALSQNELAISSNYLGSQDHNILSRSFKYTNYLDGDMFLESLKTKADIYLALFNQKGLKKDLDQSNILYKKAASLVNFSRNERRNHEDKIKFSSIVKSIYAKNIETNLMLLKSIKEDSLVENAFYYSEKSRANVLRELANNSEIKKISNIDSSIVELENSFNFNIAKLTSEIIKETTTKNLDSSKLYALEGELFDLTRQKDSLEKRIELDFPKYYNLKYQKRIAKLSDIQEHLDENTTLVEFFNSDKIIHTFIITKNAFIVRDLSIPDIDQKIQELNKSIISKNQSKYLEEAHDLFKVLIEPIKNHFVGDKLIIIPDESLWNLQFDLLITKENNTNKPAYLLYKYAISYANSVSMLFENIKQNNNTELLNECVAFSYTNSDSIATASGIDLPGTREEIMELSRIFDGQYFYNDKANEANFKTHVDKYKLVHLALHAEIDTLNIRNIKILFSDAGQSKEEDNKLYGHELYGLNIPAKLVALSACNTGVGKLNKGEGILSLGNAFQYAGAESLLLSRWKISDETTPEIMRLFYKNVKIGLNKSEALQKAKIEYLNTTDHFTSQPMYWGSFYILGNPDPIDLHNSNNIYYYIGVGLFLLLMTFFFMRRNKLS